MNSFHLVGIALALWAMLVAGLGITRDSFPATAGAERLVAAITAVLVAGAIGTAIYTAAHHEDVGEDGVKGQEALVR